MLRQKLNAILKNNDERSNKIRKNIFLNFLLKGSSVIITFLTMRILFEVLGAKTYGLWLTIFSALSWLTLIDGGLGNGLRNKVAEALAVKDYRLSRIYISTAYYTLLISVIIIYLIFLLINYYIKWSSLLNVYFISEDRLHILFIVLLGTSLINFWLLLINQISYAKQDAFIPGLITLITNLLFIITILITEVIFKNNIISVATIYGLTATATSSIISIFMYKNKYADIAPSYKLIEVRKIRELLNISTKFFILQCGAIIIFTTDNIIILKILGAKEVVEYQVVFKLFSVITTISSLVLAPTWSAFTEAYIKNDLTWIKTVISKLISSMKILTVLGILIALNHKWIIKIWMGKTFEVDIMLVVLIFIFTLITAWTNIFANFLNGISKTNVQLICLVISATINIPLSIYFAKYLNLGNTGVILGTLVAIIIPAIFLPIQTYKLLNKKI